MLNKRILISAIALMLCSFQWLNAQQVSFPLPSDKINEYSFSMVGKVSSGGLSGSGVAISQKVVLSAAHVFFNEEILDWYLTPFQWNVRHSPSNQSFDISARSYRHFSDYAEATRRFDDVPLDPSQGNSHEMFNLDAFCLIFFEDVAFGGWAGWGSNRITDDALKMIVGYPNLGYSSSDPRRQTMHSTSLSGSPAEFIFQNYDDRLGFTRRLYLTDDLSSGPGNSGGPVFALINFSTGIDWGVVGVFVGGNEGEDALAVGIDQAVEDLINSSITQSENGSSDDHGDSRGTATTVELNSSLSGDIETEGDIDYFRFDLNRTGTITAFTTGNTDTIATLENVFGNFITTNDDSGSGGNFLISRELNPGTYYIAVSHFSNEETGNYSFRIDFTESISSVDLVLGGSGDIAGEDILHPNGNVFDQVLLTGQSITLQAKPGQITRVSFMDEDEDIVQVEFSGAGSFTLTLDSVSFIPAALPSRYNQNIMYVTGKPSVVIEEADSNTFFSIFTVGTINAVNQALFPVGQVYDAKADVKLVEVINSTGLGGMQFSNAVFSGSVGKVGVDARGIPISVRLTVGDIDASGIAFPYLLFGQGSFTVPAGNPGLRITGGDLFSIEWLSCRNSTKRINNTWI